MKNQIAFATVDAYIDAQAEPAASMLSEIRSIVKEAAPLAQECISYNMPAYKFNGVLVYFAAHQHHVGFYPGRVIDDFKSLLAGFQTSKGGVQFPFGKEIPAGLVKKITEVRMAENLEKARLKGAKSVTGKPPEK